MLYFAVSTLGVQGGIQVTGSHNPSDYNGFKMLLNGRSVFGEEIQKIGRRAADGDWTEGLGSVDQVDVLDTYVDASSGFQGGAFRIGWDAGNGAGGPTLEKLIKKLPGEHFAIHTEIDGDFSEPSSGPDGRSQLGRPQGIVAEKKLDFGIAFDGDADRIGAVDGKGRVVWGDQLLMILAEPVLKEMPGATIIADVKASQILFDHIAKVGGTPLMWKTGHSLIKSKMKETGAPLAGEMSGHIFFKHRWYGFDDALYAGPPDRGGRPVGKSLTEIMDEMPKSMVTRKCVSRSTRAASSRSSRGTRAALGQRRQSRFDRRRAGHDRRRLVASARVEHAGRARRTSRGGRREWPSTTPGADRRSARAVGRRADRRHRSLDHFPAPAGVNSRS